VRIVEASVVRELLDRGIVVVAAGGGGIPVRADGTGVEAVIDKDLASAVLALEIGVPRILDLTAVEFAYLGFGTPERQPIRSMTSEEARRHLEAGEFRPGSMGPKVEAAVEFVERGGLEVVITLPERAIDGLEGRTGTRVRR
jgi:carbamate kinase